MAGEPLPAFEGPAVPGGVGMGCAAGGPLRGIEAGVAEALAPENCGGGTWQSSMTAQCVEEAAVRLTHGQEYDGEGARTPNALHGGQRWTNHQPRQARWRRLQGWRSSPAAFQMRVLPSWGRGGGFARSPIGHGEGIVERTDPLRQGGDVDVIEEGGGCRASVYIGLCHHTEGTAASV